MICTKSWNKYIPRCDCQGNMFFIYLILTNIIKLNNHAIIIIIKIGTLVWGIEKEEPFISIGCAVWRLRASNLIKLYWNIINVYRYSWWYFTTMDIKDNTIDLFISHDYGYTIKKILKLINHNNFQIFRGYRRKNDRFVVICTLPYPWLFKTDYKIVSRLFLHFHDI